MPQVIIVSNRLPVSVKKENGLLKFSASVGGLATGLASYASRRKNRWIGWPGIASDELSHEDEDLIVAELAKHNCTPVFLTQKQLDDFYNGYSNRIIWPLFHNLRRDTLDEATHQRYWRTYREINRKYAEAVLSSSDMGGHIWVHDYHLMLVPEIIRAARADVIIGFFLHVPWPASKSLKSLREGKKIVSGVLGADVAGFHTPGYVTNFLDSSQAYGWQQNVRHEVAVNGHSTRVADFPMGIDYQKYASATKSRQVKDAVKRYRKRYKGQKIIVSVDRLDPSKGLVERVKAYAALLQAYPKLRGKVVFAMVAAPSRMDVPAYQRLSKRLQILVDEINAKYGKAGWTPIDYMNVSQPFEEVSALFQAADVAFITPLRDGMNLAAKEFVASRRSGGVLILSETAGAAEELRNDALLVNPAKPETMVAALHRGLTMRRRELKRRLRHMQQELESNTVQDWARDFVGALNRPIPGTGALSLRLLLRRQLINDFRQAERRLLLLDYDGSLVPFHENFAAAKPPKSLIKLLEKLGADPTIDLVLISGRTVQDLGNWFGELPVNLVAEHGAAVKKAGTKNWTTIEKVNTKWKDDIEPILQKYTNLTPGARLEVKPHSLVWHYRAASPYHAGKYAVTLKRVLKPILKTYGLELMQGNKALEIKSARIGKGEAAQRWLKNDYGFIMSIGDDATDEDLFAILPLTSEETKVYGVKIGRGRTKATYRLPSHKDVLSLLKKLS